MNKKSLPVYLYFNLNEFYQKKMIFSTLALMNLPKSLSALSAFQTAL